MGLYDREYSREREPGYHVAAPQTATTQLVLITVGAYVLQMLAPRIEEWLELQPDWFRRPWECYTLLTYGFLHSLGESPQEPGVWHIIGNMFMLWLFGREVEHYYGRNRFIAFYLTAIVMAGLAWSVVEQIQGGTTPAIGASGGATAVLILFALNFPHREVLLYFAIPIKMWVLGVLIVMTDVFGAIRQNGQVAFTAHIGGALFALAFYKTEWLPGLALLERIKSITSRAKPRLRVHEPDGYDEPDDLSRQVDDVLKKIKEQGQASLTWSERRLLEKASRQYQQKRK
jgi:membrane associated rhomboid family serine protease